MLASPIDHHQAPRRAQHLTLIGKENPGRVSVGGNPHGIGGPDRFGLERRQKIAVHQLVAGVHHDANRQTLAGRHDLQQAGRVLADDVGAREPQPPHTVVAADHEISSDVEAA